MTSETPSGGPHDEVQRVLIRTFGNHDAAALAVANLEARGIKCWLEADDCAGMYPNLTTASGVRLRVRAEDAEAAIALLNTEASPAEISEVEKAAGIAVPAETISPLKPAWGQILCGVIVGVLVCLLFQGVSKRREVTHYHYTSDGRADKCWVYRNGREVELVKDRNLDGHWDEWIYYDRNGEIDQAEYDNNFDGKVDVVWRYADGVVERVDRDTDFNGTMDVFSTYKSNLLQQVDVKPNGSRFTTVREFYSNNVLTEIWRGGDSYGNFLEKVRYDPFFNPISTNAP